MKPEEVLPDISDESVISIGQDKCLTLTQFREVITKAAISMKVQYIQSLIQQSYSCFVEDMDGGDRLFSNGVLLNNEDQRYTNDETGEIITVSDFEWFNSGEDCKILQPGEAWQQGKFRIRVTAEFIPEEFSTDRPIESSLDDFREPL
jgi:KGK domain